MLVWCSNQFESDLLVMKCIIYTHGALDTHNKTYLVSGARCSRSKFAPFGDEASRPVDDEIGFD